jgi:integrase
VSRPGVAGDGQHAASGGLLERLLAAVRPEFRRDVLEFAADDPVFGGTACRAGTCGRTSFSSTGLCNAHIQRWVKQGRPGLEGFSATTPPQRLRAPGRGQAGGDSVIDLRDLPRQLRLEMQYALQCSRDQMAGKARPRDVQGVVRLLARSRAQSLLDKTMQEWRRDSPAHPHSMERGLLSHAHRAVEDLSRGHGWDAEYPRDTWRLRSLGLSGPDTHLRFGRIPQQWLRDLARQWIRSRLVTGISQSNTVNAMTSITRFAQFLQGEGEGTQLSDIDRGLLERYLACLGTAVPDARTRIRHVSQLSMFLQAIRRHQWDGGLLPATAVIFREDYPRGPRLLPRFLAEHVMAQVEAPASMDRWKDPNWRLITVILIRCGLRISSAISLALDCVVTDAAGAPYLRYYNTKMKREALVPVDDELCQMIRDHQQQVLSRWPGRTVPVLFPRTTANITGSHPVAGGSYRGALYRWLGDCDVRDELGQPLHLTPHQWRHTLGTRLINRDVPQHVVQKILDHDSPDMTAHYARLSDKTVRAQWEKARKVGAEGQAVQVRADGPLGDAAWTGQQLSRATQALPNGYCQLPAVKSCPHANACLTCPMFVTTAEFLPRHHAQRQATLQIITAAEASGQARVAEMNRQVAGNLAKIIAALQDEGPGTREAAASAP